MAASIAELQAQLVVDLGDYSGLVEANFEQVWEIYARLAHKPHRRYLYSKLHLISMLQLNLEQEPEFPIDEALEPRLEDRRSRLRDAYRNTLEELKNRSGAHSYAVGRPHTDQSALPERFFSLGRRLPRPGWQWWL